MNDHLIFKTSAVARTESERHGIGGKKIVIDTSWNPEFHVKTYGTVIGVPRKLTRYPIYSEPTGLPAYSDVGYGDAVNMKWKFMNDIVPEVQIGDRIYFHRNTLLSYNLDENLLDKKHLGDGEFELIFKVSYDNVFCAVRDGNIIMLGARVLVLPDMETWDDLLIPVPALGKDGKKIIDKQGNILMKPKDQWIQSKQQPEHRALIGFIEHIGEPFKGDVCDIAKGDHIIYTRFGDFEITVEGKRYFCIRQQNIEAVIEH